MLLKEIGLREILDSIMKFFAYLKKPKVYISLIVIVAIVGLVVFIGGGQEVGSVETRRVERRMVAQVIDETGTVEAAADAALGFEVAGRVARVHYKVGDKVVAGAALVSLDLGSLAAELAQAEAAVAIKQAELSNSGVNLEEVIKKQDALVNSAYTKLLVGGLAAEPTLDTYTQTPPVISGIYSGEEGQYRIRIKKQDNNEDYDLHVFGLEKLEPLEVSETGATKLGTRGLFVSFPDDVATYRDSGWEVNIPNTKSSVYATNYTAYQEALRTREAAIEDARARLNVSQGQSIAQAELERALADVARTRAEIGKRTLRAPFSGVITDIDASAGEIVSPSTVVISVLSDAQYEITVPIPEADIANIDLGDKAQVTFDAYDNEVFSATVVSVAPSARKIEGVSAFEATLVFEEVDPRILVGLSADVAIAAETRLDVLAVPARAIIRSNGRTFVRVMQGGRVREVDVEPGLRGSDGFVEITSGLAEGDEVVTFIDDVALEQM